MPLKKVYTSDVGVYRQLEETWFDRWASSATDRNRTYDEYIIWVAGVAAFYNDATEDNEIGVWVVNSTRWGGGANATCMRYNPDTGDFIGHDSRVDTIFIAGVTNGANGSVWGTSISLGGNVTFLKFNTATFEFEYHHDGDYYEGLSLGAFIAAPTISVDVANDRAIAYDGNSDVAGGRVRIYQESTGALLYTVNVCGKPVSAFIADNRRAYALSVDGLVTVFDYVTGQILGLLHVGRAPYPRIWAWDQRLKRMMAHNQVPDTLPNGDCNCFVEAYYPVPLLSGLTPPVPLRVPAVGRRVEFYSRAYGGANEGMPGLVLHYSQAAPALGTVSPQQAVTDSNGTARTFVTFTLAGDGSLTSSAEV